MRGGGVEARQGDPHADTSPPPPPRPPPLPQPFATFGAFALDKSEQVFATSPHSFACVNLKPAVPGHVLVAPTRLAPRLADLTPAEAADLWLLACAVGTVVEKAWAGESLTLCVQDGRAAGQTVPHAHVHVLPRRAGDFTPNDAVYAAVDAKEKEYSAVKPDDDRKPRTPEAMRAEAQLLRGLMDAA